MSFDQQRLIDYLEHMLQAIETINRYSEDIDELAFLHNELVKDAVSATWSCFAKPATTP